MPKIPKLNLKKKTISSENSFLGKNLHSGLLLHYLSPIFQFQSYIEKLQNSSSDKKKWKKKAKKKKTLS